MIRLTNRSVAPAAVTGAKVRAAHDDFAFPEACSLNL